MAKLTKQEIVEKIKNVDISFLNDVEQYKQNVDKIKELDETYEKEEKLAEAYETEQSKLYGVERQITKNLKEIFGKYFKLDAHENWNGEIGPDASWAYYDNLFVGNLCIARNVTLHEHWDGMKIYHFPRVIKFATEAKAEMEKDKLLYDVLMQNPEVVDYNSFVKQIEEMKQQKGLVAKIKTRRMESKRKALCLKSDVIPQFDYLLKRFDIDAYNALTEAIPQLEEQYDVYQKSCDKVETKIKEYDKKLKYTHLDNIHYLSNPWRWEEEEISQQREKSQEVVEDLEKRAKTFKLAQLFTENYEDFKNSRETMVMIYEEQLAEDNFLEELKNNYKAYKQINEIAKNENKDYNKLTDEEKFNYFEIAKDIVKVNDKYQLENDGKHGKDGTE